MRFIKILFLIHKQQQIKKRKTIKVGIVLKLTIRKAIGLDANGPEYL